MNRLPLRLLPRLATVVLVALLMLACDGPVTPVDSGEPRDGGPDGEVTVCSRDSDCGDRSLFCADWRCRPGDPGTDARGCIDVGPPCDGGACDEEADSCGSPSWCTEGRDGCISAGDCDGDGEPATECGGSDCDDDDPNRYPGNAEICDSEGHDEDCDPTTVGDTDADGDTFASSACCNGTNCGPDCDDANAAVRPGVAESCNGLDDDCDGLVDASSGALCPGGLCVAGRCDLNAWDRTFGGDVVDTAVAVAMDSAGDVYAAGQVHGAGVDFGAGSVSTMERDAFVVSYGPDGAYRWHATIFELPGRQLVGDVAVTAGGVVYAIVHLDTLPAPVDFGSGERSQGETLLLALSASDGAYQWDRVLPAVGAANRWLAVVGEDAVVVGGTYSTFPSTRYAHIVRVRNDGTEDWARDYTPATDDIRFFSGRPAVRGDGLIVAGAPPASTGGRFIAEFALSDGVRRWSQPIAHDSMGLAQVAVDSVGRIYAVGSFQNTLSLGVPCTRSGSGAATACTGSSIDAVILAFDTDRTLRWIRTFGGSGIDQLHAIVINSTDQLVVGGSFSGMANFGGGGRETLARNAGLIAAYSADNAHQWDTVFGTMSGTNAESASRAAAIGPADSTVVAGRFTGRVDFGSGTRVSNTPDAAVPLSDAFIVRLSN